MSLSVEQINKLESENERLTKEVKQWQYEYEMLDACCELYSAKVQQLKEENFNWEQINKMQEKYQQILQDIEEIAKNYLTECQGFSCDAMNEILQKISEVNK